jgi:Uncharacterized protein conserved in bacteria (DUF2169)
MDLRNLTVLPVKAAFGSTSDNEQLCTIVAKTTLRVVGGELVPVVSDSAWPVFDAPFEFDGVHLGPDAEFRRDGVDLIVFGRAIAPGGVPVPYLPLVIDCGGVQLGWYVIGDRRWIRSGRTLVATDPQPFLEMPLSNERAYGGVTLLDDQPVPHPINPVGVGYHLMRDQAENQKLPNLERPDAYLRDWQDQPRPACLYRPRGLISPADIEAASRGESDAQRIAKIVAASVLGRAFSQTVPELTVSSPDQLGPVLTLVGFADAGEVQLPMPPVDGPVAHATTGELSGSFLSRLSSLVVLVDAGIMIATYTTTFRYLFRPREKRSVEVEWTNAPWPGIAKPVVASSVDEDGGAAAGFGRMTAS